MSNEKIQNKAIPETGKRYSGFWKIVKEKTGEYAENDPKTSNTSISF